MPFSFIDKNGALKTAGVHQVEEKKQGPLPTAEYHPTFKLVRCGSCQTLGVAEFVNGFNYADADKLMDGKVIHGSCLKCNKTVELVPVPVKNKDQVEGILKTFYEVQAALTEAAKRGQKIGPNGILWPLARIQEYERKQRELENQNPASR